jgi:hypothetical protein
VENLEYFSCLDGIIANNARCTREIKSRIGENSIQHEEGLFTKKLDLSLKKETSEVMHFERSTVDEKYLKNFEMWCYKRTEKIS